MYKTKKEFMDENGSKEFDCLMNSIFSIICGFIKPTDDADIEQFQSIAGTFALMQMSDEITKEETYKKIKEFAEQAEKENPKNPEVIFVNIVNHKMGFGSCHDETFDIRHQPFDTYKQVYYELIRRFLEPENRHDEYNLILAASFFAYKVVISELENDEALDKLEALLKQAAGTNPNQSLIEFIDLLKRQMNFCPSQAVQNLDTWRRTDAEPVNFLALN